MPCTVGQRMYKTKNTPGNHNYKHGRKDNNTCLYVTAVGTILSKTGLCRLWRTSSFGWLYAPGFGGRTEVDFRRGIPGWLGLGTTGTRPASSPVGYLFRLCTLQNPWRNPVRIGFRASLFLYGGSYWDSL